MKRIVLLVAILAGTLLMFHVMLRSISDPSTGHLGIGVIGVGLSIVCGPHLVRTLISSARLARRRLFTRVAKVARRLRKLNQPAPETQLLTAAAVSIFILTWILGFFVVSLRGTPVPIYIAVSLAATAGVYDAVHRANKLTRWAWGRTTGKLMLAAAAAMTAIAAGSLANHVVYLLTGSDLALSGQFAKAITAIAWPLLFLAVLALLVILVTMLEICAVAVGWLVLTVAERLFGLRERVIQRLLIGSGAVRKGKAITVADALLYLVRALGKVAACAMFIFSLQIVLRDPWPSLRIHAMAIMAALDYEPGNTCMKSDERYGMRLDDKSRSVLTIIDGTVDHAEIVNCEVARGIFLGSSKVSQGGPTM